MNAPLVSVIMPAFNAAHTISDSITSVANQTYENWELIVIDDGSIDNTSDIVEVFKRKDDRIILLKLLKNGGLPNARNEGCRIARGEFIAFLDSDDLWYKDKLDIQINYHIENPDIQISHTDYHFFDKKKIHKRPLKHLVDLKKNKRGYLYPQLCYQNTVGILTVLVKTALLFEVNLFDISLKTMEDQDLWIRIAKEKKKFGFIDKVLAYYRLSEGGISKRIGSYKKAYKQFLAKILRDENIAPHLAQRFYYRYFGTIYYHKGQFRLSYLYFLKSIRLKPYDYIAASTYIYMLLAFINGTILKRSK